MLKEENILFTIGQFANLHEINKKTLMWYDEIGLLKPACVKENGYRYYSYQQSATLETILMLRELNVSLDNIKLFMEHRTIDSFDYLLKEKITELGQTIDLVSVDVSTSASLEKEIGKVIAETKKYQLHRLHDATYGSMIPVKNLLQGKFDEYTALYIEMPYPISKKGLHLQPAGTYLRAFCKGSWDKIPDKYKEILAYVDKQGLSLYGCAYETGINELVIDSIDEYITQIEIPVKSK